MLPDTAAMKEALVTDRINFLIWQYVFLFFVTFHRTMPVTASPSRSIMLARLHHVYVPCLGILPICIALAHSCALALHLILSRRHSLLP